MKKQNTITKFSISLQVFRKCQIQKDAQNKVHELKES